MMNDAMRATVEMVKSAVEARGYIAHVREELRTVTVFVDEDQSRYAGFCHKVNLGHVDIFESGSWREDNRSEGVAMMAVSRELDALRFRRAA